MIVLILTTTLYGLSVRLPAVTADPGQTVPIPLCVERPVNLAGFQCTITFDPLAADVVKVKPGELTDGWMIVSNTSTPGQIRLVAVDPTLKGISGPSGEIAVILMNIKNPGVATDLKLTECKFSDPEAKAISAEPGAGKIISSVTTGTDTPFAVCSLFGLILLAGIVWCAAGWSKSGTCRIAFILMILGLTPSLQALTVSIPTMSDIQSATVQIPINVDNATGVAGYQFLITFDAAVLEATGVQKGTLTADWGTPQQNLSTPGQVRIIGADLGGCSGTTGSLVIITFSVIGNTGQSTALSFSTSKLVDAAGTTLAATAVPGSFAVTDPKGHLTVVLSPDAILTLAQWRVAGGEWKNSGETLDLAPGSYTLDFKDVTGYLRPNSKSIQIVSDQTVSETGEYLLQGDIDSSGEVNIFDAIKAMQIAIGSSVVIAGQTYSEPFPAWIINLADLNTDAVVDISDVIVILNKCVEPVN